MKNAFLVLGCCFLMSACKVYHDTTAYYNAYFLAKERLDIVEQQLFGEIEDQDYEGILPIFPVLDSNYSATQKANLAYVIEKASLPIELHKSSSWVDDSYLLIGKARLYEGDFPNAINTFKYINGKFKEQSIKQASLIFLMRAFTETKDYTQVEKILENIRRSNQRFSEDNILDFNLHAALYYQRIGQMGRCAEYLELALPLISKKSKRSRLYYILGQIYQQNEKFEEAYQNYNLVLKSNPIYDLEFNAQLRAAQVFASNDPKDVLAMRRYFDNLLRDQKNEGFLDKIYFERANFEIRREKYQEAIDYFKQSLANNTKNKPLRAYAYEKIGALYFDQFRVFEQAALYYDSAMQVYTEEMPNFAGLKRRADVLDVFIGYYNTAQQTRLLLNLSKLDEPELIAYFENKIKDEKAEIDRIFEEQQRQKKRGASIVAGADKGGWYFYNPAAMLQGQQKFKELWGDRPLEDNWRRRNKPVDLTEEEKAETVAEAEEQIDRYTSVRSLEERLAEVPRSDSALARMDTMRQEALFQLGKIYFRDLAQPLDAIRALETLLREYPQNPFLAEALYLMVSLCQEQDMCQTDTYREQLKKDFPKSIFAQLLDGKTATDSSPTTSAPTNEAGVLKTYQQLFRQYEQGDYANVQQATQTLMQSNPTTRYLDKIQLLGLMAKAKNTTQWGEYATELRDFIRSHPKSELLPFANSLLEAALRRQSAD